MGFRQKDFHIRHSMVQWDASYELISYIPLVKAYNREMVNISSLNLEGSNAAEVEMESCSESMAPGAWSSASPSLTIDKFKNDGHPKVYNILDLWI